MLMRLFLRPTHWFRNFVIGGFSFLALRRGLAVIITHHIVCFGFGNFAGLVWSGDCETRPFKSKRNRPLLVRTKGISRPNLDDCKTFRFGVYHCTYGPEQRVRQQKGRSPGHYCNLQLQSMNWNYQSLSAMKDPMVAKTECDVTTAPKETAFEPQDLNSQ